MAVSTRRNPQSKRSRGVDRHTMPRKVYHAPKELFSALERYAKERGLTESEVQRISLAEYLASMGYWMDD